MADANIIVIGGNADDQDHDIPDNTDPAWRVHQGATDYIVVDTTNSSEKVELCGSGTGTVVANNAIVVQKADNTAEFRVQNSGSIRSSGMGLGSDDDILRLFADDDAAGSNSAIVFHVDGSEKVRIDADGDVGIGMTSPDLKLVVHGDDTGGVISVRNASNGRDTLKSENAAGNRTFNIGNDASGHGILLVRNSSGTTNTFITGSGDSYFNAGNVGIGTTSPGIALVVHGDDSSGVVSVKNASDSRDTFKSENAAGTRTLNIANDASGHAQLFVRDSSGTIGSFINGSGNSYFNAGDVGIGTTSPGTKLEVKGGDSLLQLNTESATGSPSLSFAQADTRRSFINHVDTDNMLKLASEYGGITFFTGTSGTETEKMRIASGGNVGIGTSSPIAQLHLQKNAGDALLLLQCNDSSFGVDEIYGHIDFGNRNYDDRICSIVAAQEAACDSGATANGYLAFFTEASGGDIGERMRIASGGNVGIGVTNPAHAIDVSGTAGLSTGTAWTNTSDSRVKQNVETIENALEKIEALRPVSFEYTQDYVDCTDGIVAGQRYNSFIAQEYAEVFPDAVSVGPDLVKESPEEEPVILLSDLKQFTPHDLNMYLVRAVQELSAQIKELKEGK